MLRSMQTPSAQLQFNSIKYKKLLADHKPLTEAEKLGIEKNALKKENNVLNTQKEGKAVSRKSCQVVEWGFLIN